MDKDHAMIDKNDPLNAEALLFHTSGRPGKFEINATKPLTSQRDLSLAYSPGVAAPCLEIAANADAAYDYTAKGNVIAVISNGTAVLGLGDIGAAVIIEGIDDETHLVDDGLEHRVSCRARDQLVELLVRVAGGKGTGSNAGPPGVFQGSFRKWLK